MATSLFFDGKKTNIPGTYSSVKSGAESVPITANYNTVLILDTGSGTGWGGSGISGAFTNGANSIYEFNNISQFQSFIRGGDWWLNAIGLFKPNKSNIAGVGKLYYVSASTTTPGTITLPFTAGNVVVSPLYEGTGNNGVVVSTLLQKGFGATLSLGTQDPTKYVVKFFVGSYKGTHADGTHIDFIAAANTKATLLAQSPELSTLTELSAWMATDYDFGQYFRFISAATGAIVVGDVALMTTPVANVGATTVYNAADIDAALTAIADLDYNIIICDKFGTDAQHANNVKVVAHLELAAKYDKIAAIAGGDTKATFNTQSIAAATFYNNEDVIVVHGGRKQKVANNGYRTFNALNKLCYVVGRILGLESQTPATFKIVDIDAETHVLSSDEKTRALDKGVLVTSYDTDLKGHIIIQGINTIQLNTDVLNPDATSHLIQVRRIVGAVNRSLLINAKISLLGNQTSGPNYNTISPEDVVTWTNSELNRLRAQVGNDNLIKAFEPAETAVQVIGDAYKVTYRYQPNYETNKILFVGVLLK